MNTQNTNYFAKLFFFLVHDFMIHSFNLHKTLAQHSNGDIFGELSVTEERGLGHLSKVVFLKLV